MTNFVDDECVQLAPLGSVGTVVPTSPHFSKVVRIGRQRAPREGVQSLAPDVDRGRARGRRQAETLTAGRESLSNPRNNVGFAWRAEPTGTMARVGE